jgi:hypothetical protein
MISRGNCIPNISLLKGHSRLEREGNISLSFVFLVSLVSLVSVLFFSSLVDLRGDVKMIFRIFLHQNLLHLSKGDEEKLSSMRRRCGFDGEKLPN